MTEQDILNKIRASADKVEIPEGLKPEKMAQKLIVEKQPKRFKWQAMHLVAAAVALVIMLGAMPLSLTWKGASGGNESTDAAAEHIIEEPDEAILEKKQDAGDLYLVAKGYEDVCDFFKNNAMIYEKYYFYADGIVFEAEKEMAAGFDTAMNSSAIRDLAGEDVAESKPASDNQEGGTFAHKLGYSTTNLQMAGVDESDIVKTNGTHIFIVKDGVIQVVKIEHGKMTQLGTISPQLDSFSDKVLEMYVDGNKLILITQQVKDSLEGMDTGRAKSEFSSMNGENAEICVDVAYNLDMSYHTVLYTYDISDPANAKQIGRVEQDGSYKTSRKINDMIYLFTEDSVVVDRGVLPESEEEIADFLPKVNGEVIAYDSIYLPEYGYQGLVVSSISLDNPNEVVDNTLIMNNYVEVYVSNSAMYLYHSEYRGEEQLTQIAKFNLKNGQISAVAAASVPGTVQDTFAVNEYEENLRVLTSHWDTSIADRTNQLYILDERLNAAGKIENIAVGETIYAARYFGDLAYFITYRNTDPLFAADLSDINNPKILGELKITGYSEYLHMWGEDKLLGIGYETDEKDGSREGIKLVMFDISNPAELSIIDTVVIKTADYSPALFNYKTVLADKYMNMIGFVTVDYSDNELAYCVYSFADGRFRENLVVEQDSMKQEESYRGLWADDCFYIVNPTKIQSFDYTKDYEAVDELNME